jgi:catalase
MATIPHDMFYGGYHHKDGKMRFFPNNPNPDAYYESNSFKGPAESPDFSR